MRELRKVFLTPPKGGNEVGVQTQSSMSPLPGPRGAESNPIGAYDGGKSERARRTEREDAGRSPEQKMQFMMREQQIADIKKTSGPLAQTSLRESFEGGEMAARNNAVQSHRVGQPEFRNYDRGIIPNQQADDPSTLQMFDFLSTQVGNPQGVVRGPVDPQYTGPRTTRPSLRPDTHLPYRTDGKPNFTMGVKPSGNSPTFRSDGDNDYDDTDDAGGISYPGRGV